MPRPQIPDSVPSDVRASLHAIWADIDRLLGARNVDWHGRRIINAGDAVDQQDYITLGQAQALGIGVPGPPGPPGEPAPGGGSLPDVTVLTEIDDTWAFPSSRIMTAGLGIAFDVSVANVFSISTLVLRGLRSAQPSAASVPGAQYFVTDDEVTEYSNGSAWLPYSTATATGGVTEISINGYYAQGATPASAGGLRLSNTHGIFSRNFAGSGNQHMMTVSASDNVVVGPSGLNDLAFWSNSTVRWRVVSTGQFRSENGSETIQWGATSAFPMLKRSSTALQLRLADDSGYGGFDAGTYAVGGVAGATGSGSSVTVVAGIVTAVSGGGGGGGGSLSDVLLLMGG